MEKEAPSDEEMPGPSCVDKITCNLERKHKIHNHTRGMESEAPSDEEMPGSSGSDANRLDREADNSKIVNKRRIWLAEKKEKERNRKKIVRSKMTPEQKELHLKKEASRFQKRRADATARKQTVDRAKDLKRKKAAQAKENDSARQSRLKAKRQYATQRWADEKIVTLDALKIIEAEEFAIGSMTEKCKNCGAKFFEGESWVDGNQKGVFNFCCLKGNLRIEDPFSNYPVKLRQLFRTECKCSIRGEFS